MERERERGWVDIMRNLKHAMEEKGKGRDNESE